MSLQLYQVDYKSYLLDFKSLSSEETEDIGRGRSDIINICVNMNMYTYVYVCMYMLQ